jgi:aspartyl-tRNA(Asn)/glutamyl-tRNA(Gln) amidotransferase subunit C
MGRDVIAAPEVRRIAALARLALSEDEIRRMTRDLCAILEYVAQLDALELPAGAPPSPAGSPATRPDDPAASLDERTALAGAPRAARGHFVVPRVLVP